MQRQSSGRASLCRSCKSQAAAGQFLLLIERPAAQLSFTWLGPYSRLLERRMRHLHGNPGEAPEGCFDLLFGYGSMRKKREVAPHAACFDGAG